MGILSIKWSKPCFRNNKNRHLQQSSTSDAKIASFCIYPPRRCIASPVAAHTNGDSSARAWKHGVAIALIQAPLLRVAWGSGPSHPVIHHSLACACRCHPANLATAQRISLTPCNSRCRTRAQPATGPRCKAAFGKLGTFPMGDHGGGTHARQDLRHHKAR